MPSLVERYCAYFSSADSTSSKTSYEEGADRMPRLIRRHDCSSDEISKQETSSSKSSKITPSKGHCGNDRILEETWLNNHTVDDGAKEKSLVNVDIPENYELECSPNLLIADTGAKTHNAPHSLGLEQVRKGTESNSVKEVNGEKIKLMYLGSIKGAITNKMG